MPEPDRSDAPRPAGPAGTPAGGAPALRPELRQRRLAVVLAGGGALGAYEVGVLRVLEALRVRPAILAGVSVGAINACAWLAHDRRTLPLERVWGTLRGRQLGLRWTSLLLRALGGLVAAIGASEAVLTLASSQELSAVRLFQRRVSVAADVQAVLLDVAAWLLVGLAGFLLLLMARPADRWVARIGSHFESAAAYRWLGRGLLLAVTVHLLTLAFAVPWPHRFSATMILVGFGFWWIGRPGQPGDRARRVWLRILPETRGRGVWPTGPRQQVIEELVAEGDIARLVDPDTHLVISACDLQSGRIVHFVNWKNPSESFRTRVAEAMGEVVPLQHPPDLLRAALASSAIPLVYEPVRLFGRDYVDAGAFSNQPIHVAIADGADAVLVVLLSPSGGVAPAVHEPNVVELGGRLLELASWREIQSELRQLPPEWTRTADPAGGGPARVCVIEPESALPGGLLAFDPQLASQHMTLGEHDAWRALEQAGWIEPAGS